MLLATVKCLNHLITLHTDLHLPARLDKISSLRRLVPPNVTVSQFVSKPNVFSAALHIWSPSVACWTWCQGQPDDLYAQTQRSQGSFRGCVSSGTLDINKWLTEIKQNFTSWNLSAHFSAAQADRTRALEFTEDPCQQPINKTGVGWRHMKHLCVSTSDLLKLAHFWNSLWDQELLTSHTGE